MALITYDINRELSQSSIGNITTYNSVTYEAIREKLLLYLSINKGEVPFTNFGNNLITSLYGVNSEIIANSIMNNLIDDLNNNLFINTNIAVVDYVLNIDPTNRSISMVLNLNDGNNVGVTL